MKETVIILSAGSILNKLSFVNPLFSNPGLMPINSKSALYYIIEFYKKNDFHDIYVVSDTNGVSEFANEPYLADNNVKIIKIDATSSIVETLYKSLSGIDTNSNCIINISTTIPTAVCNTDSVMLSDKDVKHNSRFSIIHFNGKHQHQFLSKNSTIMPLAGFPFTGVFCNNKKNILKACAGVKDKKDLLNVIVQLDAISDISYQKAEWYDIGHEINYFVTRKKLITSRQINSFTFDDNGCFVKESTNVVKLTEEVNFVKQMPNLFKIYLPNIIDFEKNESNARVFLEFYPYPNLSEYFLYWNLDESEWQVIFNHLKAILHKFKEHKASFGFKAYMDFYFKKTDDRVKQYVRQSTDTSIFEDDLVINNKTYKNWNVIKKEVIKKLTKLYQEDDFCIMHGDFCFNNILYDRIGGAIKLIDAKGNFGDKFPGIFGDNKYDMAKLLHSSYYGYDYIVNDLYVSKSKNNKHTISFFHRKHQKTTEQLVKNLIKQMDYDFKDISFMVGLLFISMCPFHSDNQQRQRTMYLHGIKILNDNL